MRVKKPTSKRQSTRLREGIKKKAAAQHRKDRKLAKKDVTWRSKHKKDPGIPSSFPYKEEIINELEQQRAEEKQRKEELRLKKQQEREAAAAAGQDVDAEMEAESEGEEGAASGGLEALMESAQQAAREYDGEDSGEAGMDSDEDVEYEFSDLEDKADIEKSRKAYDKIFKAVVEASDVVLYVLDARDPESTRLRKVEQAVLHSGTKRLIFVLNKVDLVPPRVLKQWTEFLNQSFPTVPVKASPGAAGGSLYNKNLTSAITADSLLQALKSFANKSNLKRSIVAGVIGYPNVGKSSIINALTNRHGNTKACPVGNMPGVTTTMREVKVDGKLKILDSPGIVFPDEISSKKASQQTKLALVSAVTPKQITDPIKVVEALLKRLSQDNEMADAIKSYYNVPPLPAGNVEDFAKQFLIHVARARGRLTKGGVPHVESAALNVLNDWRDGRITGWTTPKMGKSRDTSISDPSRGKEPEKEERTEVVTAWAKEFDLDGLLGSNFGLE